MVRGNRDLEATRPAAPTREAQAARGDAPSRQPLPPRP